MLNEALARRYAEALFEIVKNNDLDQTEKELIELVQLIKENVEINNVLGHPHISLSEKKSLMDSILGDRFGIIIKKFFYLLIDRRRQTLLPSALKAFRVMADEARQIIEAKVVSAKTLSADQENQLRQALVRATGKNVRVVNEQRPEVIGGMRVQVRDRVWDGTISHALNRMRKELRRSARV